MTSEVSRLIEKKIDLFIKPTFTDLTLHSSTLVKPLKHDDLRRVPSLFDEFIPLVGKTINRHGDEINNIIKTTLKETGIEVTKELSEEIFNICVSKISIDSYLKRFDIFIQSITDHFWRMSVKFDREKNIGKLSWSKFEATVKTLARRNLEKIKLDLDTLTHASTIKNEKDLKSMPDKNLPVFPSNIPLPSSISESKRYEIIPGDFKNTEDLVELFHLLFEEPEKSFFIFTEKDTQMDSPLNSVIAKGDIIVTETQFYWYKHPKHQRDFLKIEGPPDSYKWDWQKEVVEKGPMFIRSEIKLSDKKRTELEIWKKVYLEETYREQIRKEKNSYNVFLSYSTLDSKLANNIYNDIINAGGKVFLAEKSIEPGLDFSDEIRDALKGADEFWLIASPNSIESKWVISEWAAAWVLEKKIIPILHRCSPEALPDRLKAKQCIDYFKYKTIIDKKFPPHKE